jgi:hypothetical protein
VSVFEPEPEIMREADARQFRNVRRSVADFLQRDDIWWMGGDRCNAITRANRP